MTERQSPVTRADDDNRVHVQTTTLLGACFPKRRRPIRRAHRTSSISRRGPVINSIADRQCPVRASLARVKLAEVMPRADQLTIIRNRSVSDSANTCCRPRKATPRARFNVEMDRLYTIMNEGNEPNPGD
jgi:hypothetical protein